MNQKQNTFLEKVKATIAKHSMLSAGETVLVGLSGGPDSVCLLSVLNALKDELNLKLHAIYVDHGLRPDETPHEIEFCRKLCEEMSIPFVTRAIDVKSYAKEQGMNMQEAARELRYRIFDEMFHEIKADRIALGHTADDQMETFFLRFLRGSGPGGLAGIPPVRAKIIRPLIEVERQDIEEFLKVQGISYVVDSSNLKEDYFRNRLRLTLLQEFKRLNPRIAQTVSRTMDILREEERYFEIAVTRALMKLISRKTDFRIELFLAPMESMDRVILRRVLRRAIEQTKGLRGMGFQHIEDVMELVRKGKPGDRLFLPKGLRVVKNYATLIMTSEIPQRIEALTLNVPGQAVMENIKAVLNASLEERVDGYGDGKNVVVFDTDKTGTTLMVRPREKGDFFYPMGFGQRKKLQDFFVDMKVPRDERDAIPLVLSGNDIVWIAGFRADERFKVTEGTK
ncbi:MAG TPA: tRNA lysidine(34) synthetase TilS, partial [Thermodesulfovibrionales bacterium]|nr:tRNA lysidine(34) synthetase TilS [Thermodesulfovibrionales bacterium]